LLWLRTATLMNGAPLQVFDHQSFGSL